MKRAAILATALVVFAPPARADDKEACIAAHESAQALRNQGHLKDARKTLLACARDVCPALVSNDCKPWLDQANADQPTVVLSVRDEHDVETADVRVSLDGATLTEHLDGRPLDVDPGDHVLRFERPGVAPIEQRFFMHAKEKARIIQASFAPSAPIIVTPVAMVEAHGRSRFTPGVIVTGLAGIAGIGVFAAFGIVGKIDESNLASSGCKPNCDASKIDSIRTEYIAAYIALGVSVLALGTSTVLFFAAPTSDGRGGTVAFAARF